MCGRATSAHFPFAFITCTPDSKEVLGVLGFGLTWRTPSSYIKPIYASFSCSFFLIMARSAFLFGQSRDQCGLSHRKHLILSVNSFLSVLPFSSWTLGVLPNLILASLWYHAPLSLLPLAWLSSEHSTLEESPIL